MDFQEGNRGDLGQHVEMTLRGSLVAASQLIICPHGGRGSTFGVFRRRVCLDLTFSLCYTGPVCTGYGKTGAAISLSERERQLELKPAIGKDLRHSQPKPARNGQRD